MITVRQYRNDASGTCLVEIEEQVRSNRAAEARIRRWCREAGHNPIELQWADTEYGQQASLDWQNTGAAGELLWETEQGLD